MSSNLLSRLVGDRPRLIIGDSILSRLAIAVAAVLTSYVLPLSARRFVVSSPVRVLYPGAPWDGVRGDAANARHRSALQLTLSAATWTWKAMMSAMAPSLPLLYQRHGPEGRSWTQ